MDLFETEAGGGLGSMGGSFPVMDEPPSVWAAPAR